MEVIGRFSKAKGIIKQRPNYYESVKRKPNLYSFGISKQINQKSSIENLIKKTDSNFNFAQVLI